MNIKGMNVFMHITSKTLEGSHRCSDIIPIHAIIGSLKNLLLNTQMAVLIYTIAHLLMVGTKLIIILTLIKHNSARM